MTPPPSHSRTRELFTTVLAALGLAFTLFMGSRSVGAAPALGRFLDPVHGVWAVASRAELPVSAGATIPGLRSAVDVRYDDRGVPHVFAQNTDDVYRALGYVHARDRLFEMEMQTRAVAGTLAELVGARALPLDKTARAQGLAWSAERSFATVSPTSLAGRAMQSYADGVNAFIDQMTPGDVPFEYHLLGATPMHWKPVYTAYLQARMGLTLAYSEGELQRAQVEALIGSAAVAALFPENAPIVEPIQPNGQRAPRLDYVRIPDPHPTDSVKLALALGLEQAATLAVSDRPDGEVVVGSNNWAVAPRRTAAGHALLSGDPHLALSLPSVWYEAHLIVPDTLDAYGVTFAGSQLVAIGFNRDVAWTETNTGADVADYYVETVDDPAHPTKYKLDGEWKPLTVRVEQYRGKRGETLAADTIYHTHRGAMVHAGARWISRRWLVTESSVAPVLESFRHTNSAKSVFDVMTAWEPYPAPAQNVLTADRAGHIGIRSTGLYPRRPAQQAKGDVLIDGSVSANDWQGWRALKEYPQSLDPAQGYLASANQQPKDPKVDAGYLGWDWPTPWRAMRINALLRADSQVTPDAMRRYQTDPRSEQVGFFLPALLQAADHAPAPDTVLAHAARMLREWDGSFAKDNDHAALYDAIVSEISRRTWDELQLPAPTGPERAKRIATPNTMVLAELLQQPNSPWWDVRETKDVVEDRDAILRQSIVAGYALLVKQFGAPGAAWQWSNVRHANIWHLLRMPALSRLDLAVPSAPATLSPSSGDGTHGASWRMVVEMGTEVRAWGIYPGGQSGNPVSSRYDNQLRKWTEGQLDTLRFPRRPADLAGSVLRSTLTLTPEPR